MASALVIAACAIGAVVLLILAVGYCYFWRRPRKQPPSVSGSTNRTEMSESQQQARLINNNDDQGYGTEKPAAASAKPRPKFVGSAVHAKEAEAAAAETAAIDIPKVYEESDFKRISGLGSGGFGDVTLVQHKQTKQYYALKSMDKQLLVAHGTEAYAYIERDIMMRLDHPNLLHLHGTFQSPTCIFYLMDFMPGGDLMKFLENNTDEERLPLEAVRFWAAELYLALRYLHSHGILYRDIKPENILLSATGHMVLADFGLSKDFGNEEELMSRGAPSVVGSPYCMAPEVLKASRKGNYDSSADWWSFGILLYRLLYGDYPFKGQSKIQLFQNICNLKLRFPRSPNFGEADDAVKDFISKLLAKEPSQRCREEDIAAHPFWGEIDWKDVYEWKVPVPTIFGPERQMRDIKIKEYRKKNRKLPADLPPPRPFKGFTIRKVDGDASNANDDDAA